MSVLYDAIGKGYAKMRKPDPRIAALIEEALGDARSVVNVGAGAGSYESPARRVVAVEPSDTMIAQRPAGAAPVVKGVAERLPFPDGRFDAATAFLTTHHWSDIDAGLSEMKRVARRRCVFLDHDMAERHFWLLDYFPQARPLLTPLLPLEKARAAFGEVRIVTVTVPHDCTDGFFCAYWRRPHAYLDPQVRASISFFARAGDGGIAQLARDLDDGTWRKRYGHLLNESEMDYGYRLVIAEKTG